MHTDRLAINLVSLNANTPLTERLEAVATAGFRHVEVTFASVKAYLREAGADAAAFKRTLDDLDLTCIGGFENALCVFGEADARNRETRTMLENAQLLSTLGGGVIVCGSDAPATRSLDALDLLAGAMRDMAEQIPANVRLALEFNWSQAARTLKAATRVTRIADHPRVGILFDPAHYYVQPNRLTDLTPQTVRRIFHVHVNNMRDIPPDYCDCNADRVLPDDPAGAIDLAELFGRIESLGYRGLYSIEMFSDALWQLPPQPAAQRMFDSMATLLNSCSPPS